MSRPDALTHRQHLHVLAVALLTVLALVLAVSTAARASDRANLKSATSTPATSRSAMSHGYDAASDTAEVAFRVGNVGSLWRRPNVPTAAAASAIPAAPSVLVAADEGASTVARDAAESCLNSFTADTPVTLADGKQEAILKVKVGDKVLATDPETGETRAKPVEQLIRHSGKHAMVLMSLADGSVLDSTDWHPIWDASTGRFTTAADLRVGDKVETSNGQLITIAGLTGYTADLTAYNLQISTIHTYYAGATPVLVHNSCGILGKGGTQVTSKTLTRPGGDYRIDVENPAPGVRPGQLHLQTRGGEKCLYDFDQDQFVGLPSSLARQVGSDPAVARAISKGRSYSGLP